MIFQGKTNCKTVRIIFSFFLSCVEILFCFRANSCTVEKMCVDDVDNLLSELDALEGDDVDNLKEL